MASESREVIATALRDMYPDSVAGTSSPAINAIYRKEADRVLAALHDSGWVLVRRETLDQCNDYVNAIRDETDITTFPEAWVQADETLTAIRAALGGPDAHAGGAETGSLITGDEPRTCVVCGKTSTDTWCLRGKWYCNDHTPFDTPGPEDDPDDQ